MIFRFFVVPWLLVSAPAWSSVIVGVGVEGQGGQLDLASEDDADLADADHLYGRAESGSFSVSGTVAEGALPTDGKVVILCGGDDGCPPRANASAEADATKGILRAGASAGGGSGIAQAYGNASIIDDFVFRGLSRTVEIDLDVSALSGVDPSDSAAEVSFEFSARREVEPGDEGDDGIEQLASFFWSAQYFSGNYETYYALGYLGPDGWVEESGGSLPARVRFTVDLDGLRPPLPIPGWEPPVLTDFTFLLSAYAGAFPGAAMAKADESLFIKADVDSANGYRYLGRPTDPDPVSAPAALLLFGFGALGLAARRR